MQLMVLASSRSGDVDDGLSPALDRLRDGAEVEVRTSDGPDDLCSALDDVDGRLLVVAGGDGALHTVVDELWNRGELHRTRLGLLPLGTGNDFARSLRGPLEPGPAAAALLAGHDEQLDLVLCTADGGGTEGPREYVVVNAAHLGIGARAGAAASRLKPWLGPVAYPVGAVAAGVSARGWRLSVEVDGEPVLRDRRALMVGFGNGRTAGGGTPMQPDAQLDDGCFDVMVSTAIGPVRRLGYAMALRRGRHADRDDTVTTRGKHVRVTGDSVGGNIDGEIVPASRGWSFRIEPSAWTMRVPARSTGSDAGGTGGS